MPEGPEVTIIANGLHKLLNNKIILSLKINTKSRYFKKTPDGFIEFNKSLLLNNGVKVLEVKNKGKFIYWIFNNGSILFQTLGMSGGWFKHPKSNSGIELTYLDESTGDEYKLYYDDQRRFGTLKFLNNHNTAIKELELKLKTIGPDLLNDSLFSAEDFIKIMRNPKLQNRNITRVITDQKIISGIGNYLKAESLYVARINPHREVGNINDKELSYLFNSIKKKILNSYHVGGASIRHYSDINNVKGIFEFEMEVYGRKITSEGHKVIAEKIAGDTQNTYWCPFIQK
jgi:DNA-formamidopyrimidine glycosylase